jgi:hypothetical protein
MDIYEPTLTTIKQLLPRMPKGAIIAFDQFSCEKWVGETVVAIEALDIKNNQLERLNFDSYLSYIVLG